MDEQVVQRRAGRVVLVDADDRVLLLEGRDASSPGAGTWWFTPGGGVEGDETGVEAARRELAEETGIELDGLDELVGPILERDVEFSFEGVWYRQHEQFFLARLAGRGRETSDAGWTSLERRNMLGARWWALDELRSTTRTVHPDGLADLVVRHLGRDTRRAGGG